MSEPRRWWVYQNEEFGSTHVCDFNQRGFVPNSFSIAVIEAEPVLARIKELEAQLETQAKGQSMSDASEVKQKDIHVHHQSGKAFILVELHDRIVAQLKAEVDHLNRQLADAMSGCCDCPMFKAQGKTVAELKAENERLKREVRNLKDMIRLLGKELEDIEQGEGM